MEDDTCGDGVQIFGQNLAISAPFERPVEETGVEDAIVVLVVKDENRIIALGYVSEYVGHGQVLNAVDGSTAKGCSVEIARNVSGLLVTKLNPAWIGE